jgi:hypothetical protein
LFLCKIENTYHSESGNIASFRKASRNLILSVSPKINALLENTEIQKTQGFACKMNPVIEPYNVRQTLFLESCFEEGKSLHNNNCVKTILHYKNKINTVLPQKKT